MNAGRSGVPQGAAIYLAVIQFFFLTTWIIYVIYLPTLAESVGIPRGATAWLLILDQLIFTFTDFLMGFVADRASKLIGRIGPLIFATTVVSCLCFLAIPHLALAGGAATVLFYVALIVWVVTSSALRAPPWVLLGRYSATPTLPWLAALTMVGYSLGNAISAYLGVALRNTDPRLPFAISSLTLMATTAGLIWAERALERNGRPAPRRAPAEAQQIPALLSGSATGAFLFAGVLISLGFQVHIAFNSIPEYLRFSTSADLDYLLPIFWVGFNLLSLPVSALTPRWGGVRVLACAAVLGAVGTFVSSVAVNLPMTIAGQIMAGGAWGAVLTSGLATSLFLGRTGREGSMSGLWFSTQSLAACLRIAIVLAQLDRGQAFESASTWLAPLLWIGGGAVLAGLVWQETSSTRARMAGQV